MSVELKRKKGDIISADLVVGNNLFTSKLKNILDVTVLDTTGQKIGLSITISGSNIILCSLVAINNVLINVQGRT